MAHLERLTNTILAYIYYGMNIFLPSLCKLCSDVKGNKNLHNLFCQVAGIIISTLKMYVKCVALRLYIYCNLEVSHLISLPFAFDRLVEMLGSIRVRVIFFFKIMM